MKRELAKNPNCPPDVLEVLARDKGWYVRYWVARNPNTPPKALELLAKDKELDIRRILRSNN